MIAIATVLFFVFSIFLDARSTAYALSRGAEESNPIAGKTPIQAALMRPLLNIAALALPLFLALSRFAYHPPIKQIYVSLLVIMLAISFGKAHAALENFCIGRLGKSPSNGLRHLLRLKQGRAHLAFNGVYFGLPWALLTIAFVKPWILQNV